MTAVDLCIIGGGPAGLSAATMASEHGLSVLLLDERPSAGGQIYRGLVDGPFNASDLLGADYASGHAIVDRFSASSVEAQFGAMVWRVDMADDHGFVAFSRNGKSERRRFKSLILATGAMERPMPFEGWSLPGVMNVGAAQLALKSSGAVPAGRVVLAGNGPLLLLFACQMLDAGVRPTAILDTAPATAHCRIAFQHLGSLTANLDKMRKGIGFIRRLAREGVPVYRDVSGLVAKGGDKLTAVAFKSKTSTRELPADVLLVHEGVIPNTQLTRALGCQHIWDNGLRCRVTRHDDHGETSVRGVFVVGDGASIAGAAAAPASAKVTVARILQRMDKAGDAVDAVARDARRLLDKERAFRPFLEELYPPRVATSAVTDDTIICRCEDVRAGDLRRAVKDGAIGPGQAKAFTRCGMGACQGRVCGPIVSAVIAEATGQAAADVDSHNIRFPLKPITLAEMASCSDHEEVDHDHAA